MNGRISVKTKEFDKFGGLDNSVDVSYEMPPKKPAYASNERDLSITLTNGNEQSTD